MPGDSDSQASDAAPGERPPLARAGGSEDRPTGRVDAAGAALERLAAWTGARLRGLVVLLPAAAMFALAWPGFTTLPPVDRDEASFAQSSRQMAETGDLVDIRLGEVPRYKKPVGIYWLQAGAVRLAEGLGTGWDRGAGAEVPPGSAPPGQSGAAADPASATGSGAVAPVGAGGPDPAGPASQIATYRTVSLVAAILAVLLTARIGTVLAGAMTGPGAAAGLILGTSFLLGAEARLAKTDATLLLCLLAMMLPLARAWKGQVPAMAAALGFWAALGASLLIKGPIALMTVGLAVAALALWRRDLSWLRGFRPLAGLALVAIIVLPWYAAITFRAGTAFWDASIGRDLIGKVAQGQESHGAPPGTYLALLWLTFWPGAVLLALGLPALWRLRRDPAAQPAIVFCLAWALPTWVVFEAVATKLVHYVLPAYPALAILTALGWAATPDPLGGLARRGAALVLLAVPVVLAGTLAALSVDYGGPVPVFALAGIAGMILSAAAFWRWARAGRTTAAALMILPLGFFLSLSLYPTLARVPGIWPSAEMGRTFAAFRGCAAPKAVVTGYGEPSALFALGRDSLAPSAEAAADRAAAAGCAVIFVGDGASQAFDDRASRIGLRLTDLGRIEGTNLGSGKRVGLRVVAVVPGG